PDGTGTVDMSAAAQAAPLPVQCANLFPDVPPVPPQQYDFGLETRDPVPSGSVMVVTGVAQPASPWFSTLSSQQGFAFSGGRWVYRDTAGPSLAVGHLTAHAPPARRSGPRGRLPVAA